MILQSCRLKRELKLLNMPVCQHCKIEIASVNHHISYFPEKIIKLCIRCHKVIHKLKLPMYDKYKQYKKGDSSFFYGKKFKKPNRKKRFWLDIPGYERCI